MTLPRALGALALAALVAPLAQAARIDLVLDVNYIGGIPSAGGTWRLLAATDEQGLFSLTAPLAGVNLGVQNELPRGRVNSSPSLNAGFANFTANAIGPGGLFIVATQAVTPSGATEQGVFYGVGTLENGAPNYAGQPSGTTALGPFLTTLAGVQDSPWGGDLGALPTAATVASGSFPPNAMPRFGSPDLLDGFLFSAIGTSQTPGAREQADFFTTTVSTNLSFGVATGDYNDDGLVDAADYTLWRDSLGDTVTALTGADGDGDGLIDQDDYQIWRTNYGATAPATAVATPEPSAVALLAATVLAALKRPHRAEKTEQTAAVA
ncbi:hypothetical protein [Botrimarina sp.]|uniref:hypothetical protein n=1 Tax=Botrimarina sp. TaxID=2795802 RepID=UPI0032EF1B60